MTEPFDADRDRLLGITGGPPKGVETSRKPPFLLFFGLMLFAFCLGALLHSLLVPPSSMAELAADRAPCLVQVIGTTGVDEELDRWAANAKQIANQNGDELEVIRKDGYAVIAAIRCLDSMEGA